MLVVRHRLCCSFGPMVHIETDFRPRFLERKMIWQTKQDLRRRLRGHELKLRRIVLKKINGRLKLKFVGDPTSIEKAKGLLGIC
jgi:hypothetical protein